MPAWLFGGTRQRTKRLEKSASEGDTRIDDSSGGSPLTIEIGAEFPIGINQSSLPTQGVELLPDLRTNLGDKLALVLPPSHGQGFDQGSAASNVEQPHQLALRHGSTLAAAVGLLIGLGDFLERICGHPADAGIRTPVAERYDRGPMAVAGSCRPAPLGLARKPWLQRFPLQIDEPAEAASLNKLFQVDSSILAMVWNRSGGGHGVEVGVEVFADRRRQVLGRPRFRSGDQPGPHSLRLAFEVGQNLACGRLVSASGRDFDDDPFSVADSIRIRSRHRSTVRFAPSASRPAIVRSARPCG